MSDVIFSESYKNITERVASSENPWMSELRSEAYKRLANSDLPTTKLELWKYTSLKSIAQCKFASPLTDELKFEALEAWKSPNLKANYFVFVNGRFVESMSSGSIGVGSGSSTYTLFSILSKSESASIPDVLIDAVKCSLGNALGQDRGYFEILNSALVEDGLVVHLREGADPLIILHVTDSNTSGDTSLVVAPRTLVYAEPNARASIVEVFIGEDKSNAYLSAPLTEIIAKDGAEIRYLKLQADSLAAYHLGTVKQNLASGATVYSSIISLGSLLSRNDVLATLVGEGASVDIKGLTILKDAQHVDNNISVEHKAPRCESKQTFRGVFGDTSRGVFTGTISVERDAQKTNAYQSNRNLLMTDHASVDSRPQLKIFADDVKCSHGATVGHLDNDGLFYLRSRGVPLLEAKMILAKSFTSAVLEHLSSDILNDCLEKLVQDRLEEIAIYPESKRI